MPWPFSGLAGEVGRRTLPSPTPHTYLSPAPQPHFPRLDRSFDRNTAPGSVRVVTECDRGSDRWGTWVQSRFGGFGAGCPGLLMLQLLLMPFLFGSFGATLGVGGNQGKTVGKGVFVVDFGHFVREPQGDLCLNPVNFRLCLRQCVNLRALVFVYMLDLHLFRCFSFCAAVSGNQPKDKVLVDLPTSGGRFMCECFRGFFLPKRVSTTRKPTPLAKRGMVDSQVPWGLGGWFGPLLEKGPQA